MNNQDKTALVALPFILLIGIGLAYAGGDGGKEINKLTLFGFIVLLTFCIQWLVFIPSYLKSTEKFYDLTGSLTYITIIWVSLYFGNFDDTRSQLVTIMVTLWALRLGLFLFLRVIRAGEDVRFEEIKVSFLRYLMAWTLQGLWIVFTAATALVITTSNQTKNIGNIGYLGLVLWIIGFLIEVLADEQKRKFKKDPENKNNFISTGLWSWSRHPNYFGEILLWIGIAIFSYPVLHGLQYFTLFSPVFVYLLLTRVSGIPILEKRADIKWGGQDAYETYKQRTPVLILKPPKQN